jgi:hypothetical protein
MRRQTEYAYRYQSILSKQHTRIFRLVCKQFIFTAVRTSEFSCSFFFILFMLCAASPNSLVPPQQGARRRSAPWLCDRCDCVHAPNRTARAGMIHNTPFFIFYSSIHFIFLLFVLALCITCQLYFLDHVCFALYCSDPHLHFALLVSSPTSASSNPPYRTPFIVSHSPHSCRRP